MKTKHTPGPWNLEYIERILRFADKNPMAAGLDDAELYIDGINEPGRDDARLIAASPEGIAFAMAFVERGSTGMTLEALERMAVDFIAKATGEAR